MAAHAAAPTMTPVKLAGVSCHAAACGPVGNVNDNDTVLTVANGAVHDGQLVQPTNSLLISGTSNLDTHPLAVNATDLSVGYASTDAHPISEPIVWQVSASTAYRVLDVPAGGDNATAIAVDDAGEIAAQDSRTGMGYFFTSPTAAATVVPDPAGSNSPARIVALNSDWEIVDVASSAYRVNRTTGSHLSIPFDASPALAADGTTISAGVETMPNGAQRTLGLVGGTASMTSDGSVVGEISGSHWVRIDPDGTQTDLGAATGLALQQAAIAPGGDLVGWTSEPNVLDIWLVKAQSDTIKGTVLQGAVPGTPSTPSTPEPGVKVSVSGTTSDNTTFTATKTTSTDGSYGIDAPSGAYTVTFPSEVCVRDGTTVCHVKANAVVDVDRDPVMVDAIALRAHLDVKVAPDPKQTTLQINKKTGKTTPKTITVTVKITNTGTQTVTNVTAPEKLIVGYHDPSQVSEPTVPLRPDSRPKDLDLGTLKAGEDTKATYTLSAEGDGKYDVQAVVTGADPEDRTVKGTGTTQVLIGSPLLVMTSKLGRTVKSPQSRKLVKAGTAFTVDVTLENVSYIKTLDLEPYNCQFSGNASDGHTQGVNDPIQNVRTDVVQDPSEAQRLAPRHTAELACVLHTTNAPAELEAGQSPIGGGTRAVVTLPDPVGYVVTRHDDGSYTKDAKLAGTDLFVDGDTKYTVSLDDSDDKAGPSEPSTFDGTAWYLSVGVLKGLWGLTGGAISGLFAAVPQLVSKGIHAVPAALVMYVDDEMELWQAAQQNPVAMAAFLNPFTNQVLLAFKHTPELIGDVTTFVKGLQADVEARWNKIANDWYHGRYGDALTEFSDEFTSDAGNAAMILAPAVLARSPKVLAAFKAAKASIYAQVSAELASWAPKVVSAADALNVLEGVVKVGYEMSNTTLRQFFGLTDAQAAFLRNFAEENRLLIVVRSRAAESVEWIKKFGAVLKPENIKIKNVSWEDYKYLGYAKDDIGRVVINTKLPSEADVIAELARKDVAEGSTEWTDALKRLEQRRKELSKSDAGYYDALRAASKNGHMDMKWNFAENAVDPTAYTDTTTRYRFRLTAKKGDPSQLVPEYFVKGRWRSVTGDVDFLQISHADGSALSDALRVKIYQQLSKSPLGFMHPESATWTALNGAFSFDTKINEFIRAGTVAQFCPDGAVRAVRFLEKASQFISKLDYRIGWDGGYQVPTPR
ncbi:MAG TPA: hypothetical protein VFE19_05810 [Jatrophihabitantaceae bacterium]|nr:hypothetical protein [Jatrophihabitantaceae bacterium]